MILDLRSLSNIQLKSINLISRVIQNDFNNLIQEFLNDNDKFIFKFTSISSRNNYQCDLFANCVKLIFIKYELDNNKSIDTVVVYNKNLFNHLNIYYKTIKILYKKDRNENQNNFFLKPYWDLIKVFRKIFQYYFTKDISRIKNIDKEKDIILIDTFLLNNSVKKKKYIDRYYNNILDYTDPSLKSKLFFCPTLIGNFKKEELNQI